MHNTLSTAVSAMDSFVWSEQLPLAHWAVPLGTAIVYIALCCLHNARLSRGYQAAARGRAGAAMVAASTIHNIILIAISLLLACGTAREVFLWAPSLDYFLCLPPLEGPLPLQGPVHAWCYLAYLSKYYELIDTLFICLKNRRVIPLHMFHHASMPIAMWLMFYGEQTVSLCGVAVINSSVHVVMYSYYLCTVLRPAWALPLIKRSVTQLQLLQFCCGVIGNTYYFSRFFVEVEWKEGLLPVLVEQGCRGDIRISMMGFVMNLALLVMFSQFYVKTYLRTNRSKRKQQ